jgi:hypothetical protein
LEHVVSVTHETPVRSESIFVRLAAKSAALATRFSINLSRAVFVGVLALILIEAHYLPGEQTPSVKITVVSTRPGPSPVAPSSDAAPPASDKTPAAQETQHPTETTKPSPPWAQPAPPWSDDQIAAARNECDRLLGKITLIADELPPERRGLCGAPAPRLLRSLGESKVRFDPPAQLNCPMIAALNSWISEKLQPAAEKAFGAPIASVHSESYSCRNRYGLARAPVSEHAFMNAIDISSFVLANGKVIKISKGWKVASAPAPAAEGSNAASAAPEKKLAVIPAKLGANEVAKLGVVKEKTPATEREAKAKEALSAFLHDAHDQACSVFGTVLGPDANDAHHDHFHLDMKSRQANALCE